MIKGFDNLEFEMRVKKARELMEKNNIDIKIILIRYRHKIGIVEIISG